MSGLFGGGGGGADKKMGEAAKMQAEIAKAQWDRYLSLFGPMEEDFVKEVQLPAREAPGFLASLGGLRRSYGSTRADLSRSMGGKYQYGSGLEKSSMSGLMRNEARDAAGHESDWNQQRTGNMLSTMQLGRGLPASAQQGLSSAGQIYGNLAQMQAQQQAQQQQGWGSMLGNLAMMAGSSGACCFIFIAAAGGLDPVVRRYRDEHMTVRNRRGYCWLADRLVPWMEKYPIVKKAVQLLMT